MGIENKKTKDLKDWLQRSFSLKEIEINSVIQSVLNSIQAHGFEIKERKDLENGVTIKAIFGSKLIAFLVNLIPFIGKHLPSGKRLGMQASVFKNDSLKVNIRISPYMELFNTSEVLVLSQSADEKATDEYLAAHKLHSITKRIFLDLNLVIPEEFLKFDTKTFAFDTFISFLIYPLNGYKSEKKIYIPSERGPRWNWAAFIMPEIWFLWNEIWGVSILAGMIGYFLFYLVANNAIHPYLAITIFILIRFGFGRIGNKIYYYRYGYFSPSKRFVPPKNGPKWNWRAFLLPEVWFIWNEIWGLSILAVFLDIIFGVIFLNYESRYVLHLFLLAVLIARIFFGKIANNVYYARYGRWK